MANELKLVVFDVDGTLVDSQKDILGAMTSAFDAAALPVPDDAAILSVVGLSLPVAIDRLHPGLSDHDLTQAVDAYKSAYVALRALHGAGSSPFYMGMREAVLELATSDDLLLGVATGKSRRGLDLLLKAHDLQGVFVTTQVADDHPSKPHPSMLQAALANTGVEAENAVMVGDTEFDMAMASAANFASVGVTWGYHPAERLQAAQPTALVHQSDRLVPVLHDLLELRR